MGYKDMQKKEQGSAWLAIKFGCCASKDNVIDDEREGMRSTEQTDMRICYEQPRAVPQPCAKPTYARPSTSQSVSRHASQWVSDSCEYVARASSRTSISTLTRPSRLRARPSISRPTHFRHFNGLDDLPSMLDDVSMPVRCRRSFRPLELSIYLPDGCGHLSPLPDFGDDGYFPSRLERPKEAHVRDSRTSSVSSDSASSPYLIQRKPVGSQSRRTSVQSEHSAVAHERRLSGTTMGTMATPTLAFLPECSTLPDNQMPEKPSIRRSRTSGTLSPARALSRLPSPSRARANTTPSRPGSIRRTKNDVDDAIRELNTIVEERRASAYRSQTRIPALINRPPPSPSHHVPYLAPSMRMHVRSETLSDIGSAFSAPLNSKALSLTSEPGASPRPATTGRNFAPPMRLHTGPLNSNPPTPPPAITPTTPIARLGAWLKRSTSSLAFTSQPTTPKTATSFHMCETLPSLPTSASRPSTSRSYTLHTRHESQDSNDTTTATLYSTDSNTRLASSVSSIATSSPPRKLRRVPAPLKLVHEKEIAIETDIWTARSTRSSVMNMKPPMSPHANILHGMEITAKDVGANRWSLGGFRKSQAAAVGVAF